MVPEEVMVEEKAEKKDTTMKGIVDGREKKDGKEEKKEKDEMVSLNFFGVISSRWISLVEVLELVFEITLRQQWSVEL